jgi:bifunctional DNA-binding transcriptional regulator/antitoxin component of YhaV-PrlF toxin-antitoxin module
MAGFCKMSDEADLSGMSEGPAPPYDFSLLPKQSPHWKLKVGKDGRLLIPAAAIALMDLDEDGSVTLRVDEGELHVISPRAALKRIQEIMKPFRSKTHSIVDEFIAEKRAEAAREESEY